MNGWRNHHRGFSLLEVVVAFAIAALTLSVLSQIFGQGTRHLALSRDYTDAMILADSLLAEYGNFPDSATRSFADSVDRFQWSVALSPYLAAEDADADQPELDAARTSPLELMQIDIAVEWHQYGKSRSVSLSSLRIVSAQENDRALPQPL